MNFAHQRSDQQELKHWILLDSDSNTTVFCQKDYVSKIWDVESNMKIATNGGGAMMSTQKCFVPNLGEHWFNEESMTNIIALADMADKYKVTMDTSNERAMLVHMDNKIIKFKQMNNRLYAMDPRNPDEYIVHKHTDESHYKYHQAKTGDYPRETNRSQTVFQFVGVTTIATKGNYQFLETVEDNLKHLSTRQRKSAKRARRAYQAIGTPTPEDYKAMIRMNLIRNNTVRDGEGGPPKPKPNNQRTLEGECTARVHV